MQAPLPFKLATLSFLLAASSMFAAPIVADFTDGNTSAFPDGYPGSAGGGWVGGWSLGGSRLSGSSATVASANPLNGGGNYLSATFSAASGTIGQGNTQGTLQRQIQTGAGSFIDISQPVVLSFDFRPETTLTSVQSYTIFGSSSNFRGTGAPNTWLISSNAGKWSFGNSTESVDTGISITTGTVYSFTLYLDPVTKSYFATVFDGTTSFTTSSAVPFRNTDATDIGQYLNFGTKLNNGTQVNSSVTFSVDNLTIVPEPSTIALLLAGGAVAAMSLLRRRKMIS